MTESAKTPDTHVAIDCGDGMFQVVRRYATSAGDTPINSTEKLLVKMHDQLIELRSALASLTAERDRLADKCRGLEQYLGLNNIALGQKIVQLASCESALAEREAELAECRKEVQLLRQFGNKDCTAQADAAIDMAKGGAMSDQTGTIDFDGIKARVNAVAFEVTQDIFHRLPWGQEIALSNGTRGTLTKWYEPKVNAETGQTEFGIDVIGEGWHLEFVCKQTGWGGKP